MIRRTFIQSIVLSLFSPTVFGSDNKVTKYLDKNLIGTLTDIYISPEAMEDIRTWDIDQVDEITRREIYPAKD